MRDLLLATVESFRQVLYNRPPREGETAYDYQARILALLKESSERAGNPYTRAGETVALYGLVAFLMGEFPRIEGGKRE